MVLFRFYRLISQQICHYFYPELEQLGGLQGGTLKTEAHRVFNFKKEVYLKIIVSS